MPTACPSTALTPSASRASCSCPPSASRSDCPPSTRPPGLGAGPSSLGLGPAAWTQSASQPPFHAPSSLFPSSFCRCLCLGHPLSLLDSDATRLCFSLSPLCLGGRVVVERTWAWESNWIQLKSPALPFSSVGGSETGDFTSPSPSFLSCARSRVCCPTGHCVSSVRSQPSRAQHSLLGHSQVYLIFSAF